jgi:hypothetical protein
MAKIAEQNKFVKTAIFKNGKKEDRLKKIGAGIGKET